MPRSNSRNYYGHDDRGSNSELITRKVSFMNGSGRVHKNKKFEKKLVGYVFEDDDIDMGGSHERRPWKGNSQRFKSSGRSTSPSVRPQYSLPPLKLNDWYQVRIFFGAKYEKNNLLQLILRDIAPRTFVPVQYTVSEGDVIFYVDDFDVARILRGRSKKIQLPDGHMMMIRVREGSPPSVPIDDKLKEKIKNVMAKRYIPENKALDLTKFASDKDFQGEYYCPLARPALMRVVWQIINENISDLVALNLTNNKIAILEDSLSLEMKKCKNLKILHLGDNHIKSLHTLNCLKSLELTELVLKNNPLVKTYKENTHYVRVTKSVSEEVGAENTIGLFHSDIRKKFPKLVKLDDVNLPPIISFDVDEAKLPTPETTFICNPEGRGIVRAFLSQYFAIYDSEDRLELGQAYHDNSSFSYFAYYPQNQSYKSYKLHTYMQDSRNLFRINDFPRRKAKLQLGKHTIVQFLSKLPKTQHDLSSFVVDLVLFTPALINLSVNGVFREPSNTCQESAWPIRHFSRTFLIVPVGQGFCIINDMLTITNATSQEMETYFREETESSVPAAPLPPEVASITSNLQTVNLDDNVRLRMVELLANQTGMNLDWSKKCLDETQWNFERAMWTFNELLSKGSIPAEAFVK